MKIKNRPNYMSKLGFYKVDRIIDAEKGNSDFFDAVYQKYLDISSLENQ